jgi:hypothetical protein
MLPVLCLSSQRNLLVRCGAIVGSLLAGEMLKCRADPISGNTEALQRPTARKQSPYDLQTQADSARHFAALYLGDSVKFSEDQRSRRFDFAKVQLHAPADHRAITEIGAFAHRLTEVDFGEVEFRASAWGVEARTGDDVPMTTTRHVKVYVNANDQLARVEISRPDSVAAIPPEPSAMSARDQRLAAGNEIWESPDTTKSNLPTPSLREALDAIDRRGLSRTQDALLIIANYVGWSRGTDLKGHRWPPVNAWSIDLRGIARIPTTTPVAVDATNHLRHIVDETGKWRMANSVPQPDSVPDSQRDSTSITPQPSPSAAPSQPAKGNTP